MMLKTIPFFLSLLAWSPVAFAEDFSDFQRGQAQTYRNLYSDPLSTRWLGRTASGNQFAYYNDGSGSIRTAGAGITAPYWDIGCKSDAMSDDRKCTASRYDSRLVVIFTDGHPTGVCASGHDFPGRTALIRVGDGEPFVTNGDGGCLNGTFAAVVLNQLAPGVQVRVRSFKWPYDIGRDTSSVMDSTYTDALRLMAYLYSRGP